LVYAVKVRVKNDGKIKIGMPGEIKFWKIKTNEKYFVIFRALVFLWLKELATKAQKHKNFTKSNCNI
jgi:hypothetical protein